MQKKVYFFNTYLIDKLKSEATAQGAEMNFDRVYNAVKRVNDLKPTNFFSGPRMTSSRRNT
jgi:hypothetical protein